MSSVFEIWEMFVYKHTETNRYVKTHPTFQKKKKKKKIKPNGRITREILGFRMRNFQDIVFI